MTKDEALKLALEALEFMSHVDSIFANEFDFQINAIKEALAQPESEYERGFIDGMQKQMQSSVDKAVNAMTQPTYYIPNKDDRLWVGLTPQERDEINEQVYGAVPHHVAFHAAIEAKLKEKNT